MNTPRGLGALWALALLGCGSDSKLANPADSPYAPVIDPANFTRSTAIDNPYLPLKPGTVLSYQGRGESIVVEVLSQTRTVMGIACVAVRDRVSENGEVVEDTEDWYAQDNEGNVWYMGEDSKDMKNGQVVSRHGSWEAGVDGALPGIIMLARPLDGLWYRTEYYRGEAEDLAQILSLNETVTVPYGTFSNCLKILDFNALEPGVEEHKYYAPGIGVVKEVQVRGGGDALVELTAVQNE
ncbi:MAG: hypothetical protein HYW07_18480 [Candidatus Latescibacteria bacterium]|nr:hypothetical protein [Candidatus Latescibacterota bacterium]